MGACQEFAPRRRRARAWQVERARRSAVLWRFLLLAYVATLALTSLYWSEVVITTAAQVAWLLAVQVTYSVLYLLPAALLTLIVNRVGSFLPAAWLLGWLPLPGRWAIGLLAILSVLTVHVLIVIDLIVHGMYGFHLNGFVWNLVITPGGLESLGASLSTYVTFGALGLAVVGGEVVLMFAAARHQRARARMAVWPRRRLVVGCTATLLLLGVCERFALGMSELRDYRPVTTVASTFPFYMPIRLIAFGESTGWRAERDGLVGHLDESHTLDYPRAALVRADVHRDWNVVWLVAESLRADMLDPEIMPETLAFARRATTLRQHYSGGNGTRMGMFTMFYGLHGSYWFPFLAERRGPLLLDLLVESGYAFDVRTSARFTFPEFDRTIFRRVPSENLHEGDDHTPRWQLDRDHVTEMLETMDTRDTTRPMFQFMFFESTHARYYFPDEAVIRTPYVEDVNYGMLNLPADVPGLFARYVNAAHALDSQLGRVFRGLEERGLLASTIVIVTGDHGEEFMEKGRWGHHSAFSEEQVRVPLLIYAPGAEPRVVTEMSSHVDIVPTVLKLLGVTNPPGDYSLGRDLFDGGGRRKCVVADWGNLAVVQEDGKAEFPVRGARIAGGLVTTRDDRTVLDTETWMLEHRELMRDLITDLSRFRR